MGARALLLAVASLLLATPAWAGGSTTVGAGPQPNINTGGRLVEGRPGRCYFRAPPYLTMVTTTTIRINVVPEDAFDVRWSIALASAEGWPLAAAQVIQTQTADVRNHGVAAPNHTFTGLTAGTEYKYMVECRASATAPWQVVQVANFRTLRTNTADVYRVGVVADTHWYQFWHQNACGQQLNSYATLLQTVRNLGRGSIDFIVDMGDTQMLTFSGQNCQVTLTRENGSTYATTNAAANEDTVEMAARYEVWLRDMQPILAYKPIFEAFGNHEAIHGFGGAGSTLDCGFSANSTAAALGAAQAWLGNYNNAYPNTSDAVDYDGDTSVAGSENQTDGLYYEWASGAMRFFIVNPTRYRADTRAAGAHADNAFAGFVARTADTQYGGFGTGCPPATPFTMGVDSYEDNHSLGATQVGWFIARAAAKTETWGAVLSHEAISGLPASPTNTYWYQRGTLATRIDPTTGRRLTTTAWDADGDNDLSEDHYIAETMAAEGIQFRIQGHDHVHVICRKNGINYIEAGAGHGGGVVGLSPGLPWNTSPVAIDVQLWDTYDCDEDTYPDYDPSGMWSTSRDMLLNVQNGGINRATGTGNPGYGLLQINGTTTTQWDWVVSDTRDPDRNGTKIINYGPITP